MVFQQLSSPATPEESWAAAPGGSELACSEVKFCFSLLEYLGAVPTSLSALPRQILGRFYPEFTSEPLP